MTIKPIALAALLPQIPLLAWFLLSPPLVAADKHSLWHAHPLNVSAAVLQGDFGQAVWHLQHGEDPNRAYPVPGEASADPERPMTPLEAAVQRGELDMVKVLLDAGAIADSRERQRLSCLALRREAEEIAEFLIGSVPAARDCATFESPEAGSSR